VSAKTHYSPVVEGNSIRSTERMTAHRDTICRLLVEVGDGCAQCMGGERQFSPRAAAHWVRPVPDV